MTRLLTCTAVALFMGLTPALAADAAADTSSTPPVQHGVSPDAAKQATMPDSGSADTSGGAAEQSSASPQSAAGSGSSDASVPTANGSDPSSGAKEQSSAPPNSSAAENKPNPTLNQQGQTKQE